MIILSFDVFFTCDNCKPGSKLYQIDDDNKEYMESMKQRMKTITKSSNYIIVQ